jgi:hypothetical protein
MYKAWLTISTNGPLVREYMFTTYCNQEYFHYAFYIDVWLPQLLAY